MQLQTNSVGMLSLLRGNDMMLPPWFTLHQGFGEAKLRGDPLDGEGVGGGVKAQVDDCKSNLFSELAIKEEAGFKVASKQVLSVRQEEGVDVEEALLLLATLRLST